MSVDYVTAIEDMWEPSVNARKKAVGTCCRICVGRLKASASAMAVGNALVINVSATRVSLGRSMGRSVSATTSPARDTRVFSAQVSDIIRLNFLSQLYV